MVGVTFKFTASLRELSSLIFYQDIPGYISPDSRNKLLGFDRANQSNETMLKTMLNEEDTMVDEDGSAHEEITSVSRKQSVDSNGSNRDDHSISSKSYSSKCKSICLRKLSKTSTVLIKYLTSNYISYKLTLVSIVPSTTSY